MNIISIFLRLLLFTVLFSVYHPISTIYAANEVTTNYIEDSSLIANPERGLLHYPGDCATNTLDLSTLQLYRTSEHITLVMCNFYLTNFKNSEINQITLDTLASQLSIVRASGLKTLLRFAYTESPTGDDANVTRIIAHLDQLQPILRQFSDIIYVWQAGFIGAWGEWYYTQNFGDQGTLSPQNWNDRKAVVDKMLSVLPNNMLSLRTPNFKRTMYSNSALTALQAFNGTAIARLGHHNDAFVSTASDMGTYIDTSIEYPYLAAETNYVPMGGENNEYYSPRTDCANTMIEMAQFHWSYINTDYGAPYDGNWSSCMTTIQKKLGYRFLLTQATYSNSVESGGTMTLNYTVKNDGYASTYYARPVYAVLYNNSHTYSILLPQDSRNWKGGTTIIVNQTISVPNNIVIGTYNLALWMPDSATALQTSSYYSIRLANTGTWDPTLGYNVLSNAINVTASTYPTTLTNVYTTFGILKYNRYVTLSRLKSGDTMYLKNFDSNKLKLLQIFLYDYAKKGNQGFTKTTLSSTSFRLRVTSDLPINKRYAYVAKFQDKTTGIIATKYFVFWTGSSSRLGVIK